MVKYHTKPNKSTKSTNHNLAKYLLKNLEDMYVTSRIAQHNTANFVKIGHLMPVVLKFTH